MGSSTLVIPVASPPLRRKKGSKAVWLILPALLFLTAFIVLPYLNIVQMSFQSSTTGTSVASTYTLGNYRAVLTDSFGLKVLLDTVVLGFTVVPICLALGFPVAYHLSRASPRLASVLYVLILSPLLVGVVVRSFGWLILLSGNGVVNEFLQFSGLSRERLALMNNWLGVTVGMVHVLLPFMILPILNSLQNIDPSLAQAARSLGASSTRAFLRITLPLARPGIQAGCILVFVLSISAYVTPMMLGGNQIKTMSMLIVQNLIDNFQWQLGSAQALVISAAGALIVAIFVVVFKVKHQ